MKTFYCNGNSIQFDETEVYLQIIHAVAHVIDAYSTIINIFGSSAQPSSFYDEIINYNISLYSANFKCSSPKILKHLYELNRVFEFIKKNSPSTLERTIYFSKLFNDALKSSDISEFEFNTHTIDTTVAAKFVILNTKHPVNKFFARFHSR